jgi:hypothetical protein
MAKQQKPDLQRASPAREPGLQPLLELQSEETETGCEAPGRFPPRSGLHARHVLLRRPMATQDLAPGAEPMSRASRTVLEGEPIKTRKRRAPWDRCRRQGCRQRWRCCCPLRFREWVEKLLSSGCPQMLPPSSFSSWSDVWSWLPAPVHENEKSWSAGGVSYGSSLAPVRLGVGRDLLLHQLQSLKRATEVEHRCRGFLPCCCFFSPSSASHLFWGRRERLCKFARITGRTEIPLGAVRSGDETKPGVTMQCDAS